MKELVEHIGIAKYSNSIILATIFKKAGIMLHAVHDAFSFQKMLVINSSLPYTDLIISSIGQNRNNPVPWKNRLFFSYIFSQLLYISIYKVLLCFNKDHHFGFFIFKTDIQLVVFHLAANLILQFNSAACCTNITEFSTFNVWRMIYRANFLNHVISVHAVFLIFFLYLYNLSSWCIPIYYSIEGAGLEQIDLGNFDKISSHYKYRLQK